ncbi:MAG: hypothetical protein DDT40_01844 [candidate division WS2 bacterium]|nr:hypothetical protein [Candidatus Psychracetigena formicireducens]
MVSDEILLRLLHYAPADALDSPLSPVKSNVLGRPNNASWPIINDVIKTAPKTDDLTLRKSARVFIYMGQRKSTHNYLFASQEIIFDVLVSMSWEEIDQRQSWICDRLNEIVFDRRITGIGKVEYKDGRVIPVPAGFVGYRLRYEIGSAQ